MRIRLAQIKRPHRARQIIGCRAQPSDPGNIRGPHGAHQRRPSLIVGPGVPNQFGGLILDNNSRGNVVGGPNISARNLVSGNVNAGLWINGSGASGNTVQGNWADFRGDNISLAFRTDRNRSRIDTFGLFTGQVGYAWNNALVYVKGGAAVTRDKYDIFDVPTGLLTDTARETRWGGTVGIGLEYGFASNWSVGVEYDHLFMGTRDVSFATVAGVFDGTDRIRQDVDLFTARLNYKFGGPVVARY